MSIDGCSGDTDTDFRRTAAFTFHGPEQGTAPVGRFLTNAPTPENASLELHRRLTAGNLRKENALHRIQSIAARKPFLR